MFIMLARVLEIVVSSSKLDILAEELVAAVFKGAVVSFSFAGGSVDTRPVAFILESLAKLLSLEALTPVAV